MGREQDLANALEVGRGFISQSFVMELRPSTRLKILH